MKCDRPRNKDEVNEMSEAKKVELFQKLAGSRQALVSVLDDVNEEDWQTVVYSEEAEWTIRDLFGHLVDAERGMTRLIEIIKEGGEGVPADFDQSRWNARAVQKSASKTPKELTDEMALNRAHLLEVLNTLTDSDWEKTGRHASLRILSIEEILNLIADHECRHMEDMSRALEGNKRSGT